MIIAESSKLELLQFIVKCYTTYSKGTNHSFFKKNHDQY